MGKKGRTYESGKRWIRVVVSMLSMGEGGGERSEMIRDEPQI